MAKYVLSERDSQRLQRMLSWFERHSGGPQHRRRNITASGRQLRRAKIQTVAPTDDKDKLSVKLLDSAGEVTGDAFLATPVMHLGTNDLDGDIWPSYSADDIVPVFKDVDGTWYVDQTFDDASPC